MKEWVKCTRIKLNYDCCSVTQSCPTLETPWTATHQDSLSLTISWSLPKFMYIASVMPFSHLILWCRLLLLPSIFPSIRDFSSELAVRIRWPKHWSFSISPSKGYSGLISLKIDWFDLAVQGTFRNLLQHHSLKTPILRCSAFFMVQLSQPYVTIGKTTALIMWTFVVRVTPLLFNTLFRSVVPFLPRSNRPLISRLQYCPQWFWSSRRGKLTTSTFSPSTCPAVMEPDAMFLV